MTSWEELDAEVDALHLHAPNSSQQREEDFPSLSNTPSPSTNQPTPGPLPRTAPSPSPWTKLFASPSAPPSSSTGATPVRPSLTSSQPIVLPFVHKQPVLVASAQPDPPSSSSYPPSSTPTPPSPAPASASVPSFLPTASSAASSPSVSHLILDTGAFITGASLTTYGPSCVYLTPSQMAAELRDEASLHRYRTFPFPILTRQPTAEAVAAVTSFAQLTGDAASLSVTDLLVLALAWQTEKQVNGTNYLKERPSAINEQAVAAIISSGGQPTELSADKPEAQSEGDDRPAADLPGWDDAGDAGHENEDDGEGEDEEEEDQEEEEEVAQEEPAADAAVATGEDDGEGVWITPDNLHQHAEHSARQRVSLAHPSSVATITTDYAMQVTHSTTHNTRTQALHAHAVWGRR